MIGLLVYLKLDDGPTALKHQLSSKHSRQSSTASRTCTASCAGGEDFSACKMTEAEANRVVGDAKRTRLLLAGVVPCRRP